MKYRIVRNNQSYGPYDVKTLEHYVCLGNILMQDIAQEENGTKNTTVRQVLLRAGIRPKIVTNGNIFKQIKAFGWDLLLPRSAYSIKTWKQDKRLLFISFVGLSPVLLIRFTGATYFTFYAIAFYFSFIWGLFFYYFFKTPQVSTRKTITVFFATQVLIFFLVDVLRVTDMNPLYLLTKSTSFPLRWVGFTAGVGVFEEFCKAVAVFFICSRGKEPQLPQTAVFYGLMSGIGFGVFEGVQYQILVNSKMDYGSGFFMNIARLTSLPFLHAIWAGIAGYFVALSYLFPKNRQSFWLLAIVIPALLHGSYDTFGWSLPGLAVSYLGVALLILYLQHAKDFQNKLIP
jgi:protease PrsW